MDQILLRSEFDSHRVSRTCRFMPNLSNVQTRLVDQLLVSYEFDPHCVSYTCRFVPNLSSVHQTRLVD